MRVLMMVPDCQMIDRRVLQQGRTLVEAGYEVVLLAGFECAKAEEYDWHGVRVVRCQFDWDDTRLRAIRAKLPDNDRLKGLVNKLWMKVIVRGLSIKPYDTFVLAQGRRSRADVVHVHDLPLLKHGVILSREWGVPLVFDAHEIYYEQECLPPRVQRRLRREERRGVPRTALFSTVNEAIALHYEKLYGRKPMVLLNCADRPAAGFDAESRELLRKKAGLASDAGVVLYQGWISGERNLTTLVRAAEFLPAGSYLVMIGYGAHEADLRAIVEGKAWADKVRFLGRVEPEDILPLTAGADVGVIPYLPIDLNHELCSPNKFFEYVQSGVPVVAHDLVFFRGMKEKYGVVEVGDLSNPAGMAQAINSLAADSGTLKSMRGACARAAEELNWEVEGKKLLAAYRNLSV